MPTGPAAVKGQGLFRVCYQLVLAWLHAAAAKRVAVRVPAPCMGWTSGLAGRQAKPCAHIGNGFAPGNPRERSGADTSP